MSLQLSRVCYNGNRFRIREIKKRIRKETKKIPQREAKKGFKDFRNFPPTTVSSSRNEIVSYQVRINCSRNLLSETKVFRAISRRICDEDYSSILSRGRSPLHNLTRNLQSTARRRCFRKTTFSRLCSHNLSSGVLFRNHSRPLYALLALEKMTDNSGMRIFFFDI